MSVNPLRGEVSIELEGVEYGLRPTYQAITAIEDSLGRSVLELAVASDAAQLTVRQMALIVTEFIRAWGSENDRPETAQFKPERVAELLVEAGLMRVQPRVSLVLGQAVTGGHKPGEATAAGTTTKTTTDTPAAD